MRALPATVLSLLLVLSNIALAADIHTQSFGGPHQPTPELHNGLSCGDSGDNHFHCHHCCHAQSHFTSLPQPGRADLNMPGHDWLSIDISLTPPPGYAPPVPPPKA